MKHKMLTISIVLIVIGFLTIRIGDSLSTITESGVLQDSILMPIGFIMFTLGLLILVITILWYIIRFIRNQLNKA